MKTATVKELKQELSTRSQNELLELCLRLSRFKKENKELLTYLLFEADDEAAFIEGVKREIKLDFEGINTSSYYFMKKSIRKILRNTKKYIRYSKKKETEVELLIYFCAELIKMKPSIQNNTVLYNLYKRQIASIKNAIATLHEDLQYDYLVELDKIKLWD
jgi:hypothetical protein